MLVLSACGVVFIVVVVFAGIVSLVVNVDDFKLMRNWLMMSLIHMVAAVSAFEEWMSVPGYFGVESAVLIGGVVYLSCGSIGFLKFIISFYVVAIP